ncbi:hypothetical protein [Streptomyces sp. NBC_00079]|uniref:hypothetical protein n=1 Tax=Streptomyces sp. NBC_00079 TaxID=2975644 RepID=UPI003243CD28
MRSWRVWLTALGTAAVLSTTGIASAAEHSTNTRNSVAVTGPQAQEPPATKTCNNFTITHSGTWDFRTTGGQKIYIDVFNASLSPANISAQQVVGSSAQNLYHGVLGIHQSATFTATMWGSEPLTYNLRFGVDGPNLDAIGIRVRSYAC